MLKLRGKFITEFLERSDFMDNKHDEKKMRSDLYRDISKLVSEGEASNPDDFLRSMTKLMDSEDYEKITENIYSSESYENIESEGCNEKREKNISEIEKAGEKLKRSYMEHFGSVNNQSVYNEEVHENYVIQDADDMPYSGKSSFSYDTEEAEDDWVDLDEKYCQEEYDENLVNSDSYEEAIMNDARQEPDEETDKTDEVNVDSQEVNTEAKKKSNLVYNIILVACICVFAYCIIKIGSYFYMSHQYKKGMGELQNIVGSIATDARPIEKTEPDIVFPDELVYASMSVSDNYNNEISDKWATTYKTLTETNSDCMGWIQIPETNINYPVMYAPTQVDKYLYRDFEGKYLYRGLPFLDEQTKLNESQNYIIYGHHMADGTAFHDLVKYLNSGWVDQHQYMYLNTAYGEGIYQVMDVVITKIFLQDDECFKYYKYTGVLNEDEFDTYVYYMNKMSSYNSGITAAYGDQLVSLSTCYRTYDPDGRLVVVFKRIQ